MTGLTRFATRTLNVAIASCLGMMSLFVFMNVLLRYVFHSGLPWSEELSRYLFVWLIFLGSIIALKDNGHLTVDLVTNKLPPGVKRITFLLRNALILVILGLFLDGSIKVTKTMVDSSGPATGLPLIFVHGAGVVMTVCMVIIMINNTISLFPGKNKIQTSSKVINKNSGAEPG